MIGKLIAIFAAVAVAEPCGFCGGYLSSGCGTGCVSALWSNIYGNVYSSGVSKVACAVPVVSAYSPVLPPYASTIVSPALSVYGCSTFGGCRTGLLSY